MIICGRALYSEIRAQDALTSVRVVGRISDKYSLILTLNDSIRPYLLL